MGIITYGSTLTGSSGVNGDAFYISPEKQVFVLADGASGAGKSGKVLMSNTCTEIAHEYDYSSSSLTANEYIDTLFWKINNRLIKISQDSRELAYGTIVIAVIDNGMLTVTTFGDSPAYLMSGNDIRRVAKSKKRYENMIDKGFITREEYEGYIHQMHEMMWCCFDRFLPEVVPNNVIEQYQLKQGDLFLMCCDGMSDWISPEDMFKTIKNGGVKNGVEELISLSKQISIADHKSFDDITAIAVLYT